jgi:hypothetical protein
MCGDPRRDTYLASTELDRLTLQAGKQRGLNVLLSRSIGLVRAKPPTPSYRFGGLTCAVAV